MNNFLQHIISKFKSRTVIALAIMMLILSGCGALEEEIHDSLINPILNEASKQIEETVNEATQQLGDSLSQVTDELQNVTGTNDTETTDMEVSKAQPLTSFEEVAQYLREYQQLPPNYLTKEEASALGWVAEKGNLHLVAPDMSIGGDRFGNREGLLPKAEGRVWYEADINYESGTRNADRIVFSNDGLIYMTTDHYASFTDITDEGSVIDE